MTAPNTNDSEAVHTVSVVIPVYQGERTLSAVIDELVPMTEPFTTPLGNRMVVEEILLVHDNGPDRSDVTIRDLAARLPFVKAVWLSRNFGQHAATLAGMSSSGGDWIATLDEDGQHDPADIARMLDTALSERAGVVYGKPTNASSHGAFRDATSKGAKWVLRKVFGGDGSGDYQSYRLVLGEIGRSVAAYAGARVYLDVALSWVNARTATTPILLRDEGDRQSGYSFRSLLGHFLRMVLSSGTRGLRHVAALGVAFAVVGVLLAIYFAGVRLFSDDVPEGWTSTIVVILISSGAILFSLGIIAEYVGVAVSQALGRPLYLIVRDPEQGPLGRRRDSGPR